MIQYDNPSPSLRVYRRCGPLAPSLSLLRAGFHPQYHDTIHRRDIRFAIHASRSLTGCACPRSLARIADLRNERPLKLEPRPCAGQPLQSTSIPPSIPTSCIQGKAAALHPPTVPLQSIRYLTRATVHEKQTVFPVAILCLSTLLSAATSV
jgi:hypothetical protein